MEFNLVDLSQLPECIESVFKDSNRDNIKLNEFDNHMRCDCNSIYPKWMKLGELVMLNGNPKSIGEVVNIDGNVVTIKFKEFTVTYNYWDISRFLTRVNSMDLIDIDKIESILGKVLKYSIKSRFNEYKYIQLVTDIREINNLLYINNMKLDSLISMGATIDNVPINKVINL
jgi:hypothetical protein